MPTDFDLTPDQDVRVDSTGDFGTVSGEENVRQQHVNAILRAVSMVNAGYVNISAREDLRQGIENELDNLDYVENYEINVTEESPRTMKATVNTNSIVEPVSEEVEI